MMSFCGVRILLRRSTNFDIMILLPALSERDDAGELLAREKLEHRAAASRNEGYALEEPEFLERRHRLASSRERKGLAVPCDRLPHRLCALGVGAVLKNAHGAVPDDGARFRDLLREPLYAPPADIERSPSMPDHVLGHKNVPIAEDRAD